VDEVQVDRSPYAGMTDEQVLARACKACKKASRLPPGSIERTIQWAVFDGAMAELDQRAFRHILGKLKDAG
jgi:hypothetical protein